MSPSWIVYVCTGVVTAVGAAGVGSVVDAGVGVSERSASTGVAVAVVENDGVDVASTRGSSPALSLSGGRIARKIATTLPTISASTAPRYAIAVGAAASGARHRRHTSSPCSPQYSRPHVGHSASAGRSQ